MVFALAATVLVAACVESAYWVMRSVDSQMAKPVMKDPEVLKKLDKAEPLKPFYMLILGVDQRPGEAKSRTDTIIVARVDAQKKNVRMISIPRDTKVEIPGYGTQKVNSAHFYGGPSLAITTVEDFLGVPINYYMEVDFIGFQRAVDALGGVWIDVDQEIDDVKASSHSPKRRARRIPAGRQKLNGERALTYVRSRDFPDADYSRMRHQQTFFRALVDQSLTVENLTKLPAVVGTLSEHVTTNMSVGEMARVGLALRGIPAGGMQTATIKSEWQSPYVVADEVAKQELVAAFMVGGDIDGTSLPSQSTTRTPSSITVAVRNGAGIGGIAKEAADQLKTGGYKVGEVGNAQKFVYDETLVVYKDDSEAAKSVLSTLGKGRVVQSRGMYKFTGDVLVVVGRDWRLGDLTNRRP